MGKGARTLVAIALLGLLASSAANAQDARKTPYWASLASGEAMMRTGPGKNYPGIWLYKRRDLPVKVLQLHENWRKVEDPDGIQGWILVTMLSARRTAMIKPGMVSSLRASPDAGAAVRYRAEGGVVGRLDHCDGSFCHVKVGDREAYVAMGDLYGVDPNEQFEE